MITLEELKKDKEILEEKFRKYEEQEQQKIENEFKLEYPDFMDDTYNFSMFGYFKNEQDCQRAIELFGDEIKELF